MEISTVGTVGRQRRTAPAILYFDASGAAGLTRGFLLTGMGLVLWLVLGIAITTWYDRRGLDRMQPEVLDYMNRSAAAYAEGASQPPPPR